jgi:hypothetical protein
MAEETITTRAGPIVPAPRAIPEAQERPTGVRALSTFSVVEQRAILALVAAEDWQPDRPPADHRTTEGSRR